MPEKLKNMIEEIAREYLNNALILHYDICTCQKCRQDMLSLAVAKIPPEYISLCPGEEAPRELRAAIRDKYKGEIVKELMQAIGVVSQNPGHPLKEDKEKAFTALLDRILQDRGLDFRQYHSGVIKRKVALRMRENRLESYADYARFLAQSPGEYEKLLAELCINVSGFFRDPEVWVTVRYLFENLLKEKKLKNDKSLVVWSAGCASGEETYTIAILLRELFREDWQNFSLTLLGTDIDKNCLLAARAGIYAKESLKDVEDRHLDAYFIALGGGRYQVREEIRKMASFQYLDLIREDYIKDTDVVFCRNVFIYFNRDLQEQLLMKLYNSLRPGGYLIKGKSEAIFSEAGRIFKDIDTSARIYQKQEA